MSLETKALGRELGMSCLIVYREDELSGGPAVRDEFSAGILI